MTIAVGFIAQSAVVAGVTLSGVTTIGLTETGAAVDVRSDGELYAKVTPVIPANSEVEFETRDIAAAITRGTTGSLSMVAGKMTGGVTISGTVTIAASSCTVLSVVRGTDINGQAVLRGSARVNSADGAASGVTITSA
jgi:hypothetical protein